MTIDWKRKLTSRKLWVAVAGFAAGLIVYFGGTEARAAQTEGLILAAASVVGYLVGEGLADSSATVTVSNEEKEEKGGENNG